jgi:hypothetical protein
VGVSGPLMSVCLTNKCLALVFCLYDSQAVGFKILCYLVVLEVTEWLINLEKSHVSSVIAALMHRRTCCLQFSMHYLKFLDVFLFLE